MIRDVLGSSSPSTTEPPPTAMAKTLSDVGLELCAARERIRLVLLGETATETLSTLGEPDAASSAEINRRLPLSPAYGFAIIAIAISREFSVNFWRAGSRLQSAAGVIGRQRFQLPHAEIALAAVNFWRTGCRLQSSAGAIGRHRFQLAHAGAEIALAAVNFWRAGCRLQLSAAGASVLQKDQNCRQLAFGAMSTIAEARTVDLVRSKALEALSSHLDDGPCCHALW